MAGGANRPGPAAREAGVEWLKVEQDRRRDLTPRESWRVSIADLAAAVEADLAQEG